MWQEHRQKFAYLLKNIKNQTRRFLSFTFGFSMFTHVCHLASDFHAQCNCQLHINCQCTHSAKVFSIPLLLCVHRCFAAAAIYIMSAAVPKEFRPLMAHCVVSCFEMFSIVFQSPDHCQSFCSKSALIDRDGCYCQRKFSSLHCATRTVEM